MKYFSFPLAFIESCRGLQHMGFQFGMSVGTLFNHIRHVALSPALAISDVPICEIN